MRCRDKFESEDLSSFRIKISKEASRKLSSIKFSRIGSKLKKGGEKLPFWELTPIIPSLINRSKTLTRNSKIKMRI